MKRASATDQISYHLLPGIALPILMYSENVFAGMDGSAFVGLYTAFGNIVCISILMVALAIRGINTFLKTIAAILFFLACLLFIHSWYAFAKELDKFGPINDITMVAIPGIFVVTLTACYLFISANNKFVSRAATSVIGLVSIAGVILFGLSYIDDLSNEKYRQKMQARKATNIPIRSNTESETDRRSRYQMPKRPPSPKVSFPAPLATEVDLQGPSSIREKPQ